ncbi:hypothetical protein AAFN60_01975 [Roseibacillus persicicus]|uniref:hypothetical protein n=1 Tax=Roseibacillus persicicus TaxID=454148 RepID=UPI00398A90C2
MTLDVLVSELRLKGHDVSKSEVDTELQLADSAGDAVRIRSKHGIVSASLTPAGRHTLGAENL